MILSCAAQIIRGFMNDRILCLRKRIRSTFRRTGDFYNRFSHFASLISLRARLKRFCSETT